MAWETIEGPKLYKHDGWYYVFAPAGGVKAGWQGVFRSRKKGPYEGRDVLDQGAGAINGPHQGAFIPPPARAGSCISRTPTPMVAGFICNR
jgi:hypothetical protein